MFALDLMVFETSGNIPSVQLNVYDHFIIIQFFCKHLDEHAGNADSLWWRSKRDEQLIFMVLQQVYALNSSVFFFLSTHQTAFPRSGRSGPLVERQSVKEQTLFPSRLHYRSNPQQWRSSSFYFLRLLYHKLLDSRLYLCR